MEEIFKDIKNFEGLYQVSNLGRIKSLPKKARRNTKITLLKERLIKCCVNSGGYYRVCLTKNNKCYWFRIHRLVAQAFIPNPNNKPNVNHIDENPKNNNVNNLEWCTQLENVIHSVLLHKKRCGSKEIEKLDLNGNFIEKYYSAREAGRQNNCKSSNISKVANGYRKQSGGYKWKYSIL